MTPDAIAEAEARLREARATHTPVAPLTEQLPGFTLADGYAVQQLARERVGELVGWKLGLTSLAKQVQLGSSAPIFGHLAAAHVMDLGTPLDPTTCFAPRAEPEIAFLLGRDLAGASVSAADVLLATRAVAAAIEVPDSCYRPGATVPDLVADGASAGRFVVGTPVPVEGIDLRLVGVVFEHNGTVVATASGAAVLGQPAAAVAWLVRTLAANGSGLQAGQVVLSGGLTAAVDLAAGDVVTASIDRLGTVELACE